MAIASASVPITCWAAPLDAVDTTALLVPWLEGDGPDVHRGLDAATSGELSRALSSGEFTGKSYEVFNTPLADRRWRAQRVSLIGLGQASQFTSDTARRAAVAAGVAARQRRIDRAAFVLP